MTDIEADTLADYELDRAEYEVEQAALYGGWGDEL